MDKMVRQTLYIPNSNSRSHAIAKISKPCCIH